MPRCTIYLALENQMQATREYSEKGQDDDDIVIPREPWKWIVSGRIAMPRVNRIFRNALPSDENRMSCGKRVRWL
jgi:hypothetical protein